jgi:DNA-binding IclR family transcriptional regulator
MTATWPLDEFLALLGLATLTARELAEAPHELDATCTRATLETGEVYVWDNRRSLWVC